MFLSCKFLKFIGGALFYGIGGPFTVYFKKSNQIIVIIY